MSETAKFRWGGSIFACRIIGEGTEGRTRVEALAHGPRFAAGTELEVREDELIRTAAAAEISAPILRTDAMQATMDAERQNLPTVQEIIADPNFTPPLSASNSAAAQNTKEDPMSDRLTEKLKAVAAGTAEVTAAIESRADVFLARKDALMKRQDEVFAMHEQVLASSEVGLDAVEGALRQFSNSLPAGA